MVSKVLDASAFYAGVPFGADDDWRTTPQVMEEVGHIKKRHGILDAMIESGRLAVAEPLPDNVRRAREAAGRTGDIGRLSGQDVSVLALAVQTGGQLVTDDFAVSNVARSLGIPVMPVMTRGIKDEGTWIHYCPGCGKSFGGKVECPLCGNALRRRLVKRR